jgi:hypothetical protein
LTTTNARLELNLENLLSEAASKPVKILAVEISAGARRTDANVPNRELRHLAGSLKRAV